MNTNKDWSAQNHFNVLEGHVYLRIVL